MSSWTGGLDRRGVIWGNGSMDPNGFTILLFLQPSLTVPRRSAFYTHLTLLFPWLLHMNRLFSSSNPFLVSVKIRGLFVSLVPVFLCSRRCRTVRLSLTARGECVSVECCRREIHVVCQSWETSIGPCRGLWLGSIPLCYGVVYPPVAVSHSWRLRCSKHLDSWRFTTAALGE